MSKAEYRLARQRNDGVAFAHVTVEATESDEKTFPIRAEAVDVWWRAAATLGAQYAHDQWLRAHTNRFVKIEIVAVVEAPADTTHMAVVYVSYHATCRALGIAPDGRVELRDDWIYVFPQVAGS